MGTASPVERGTGVQEQRRQWSAGCRGAVASPITSWSNPLPLLAQLLLQQSVREAKIWGASEEHCSGPVCRPDDDQLRNTGQQHNGQTSSANLQICFYLCKEIV